MQCAEKNLKKMSGSSSESEDNQQGFINIVKNYPVLMDKSQLCEVKKEKRKALEEIRRRLRSELQMEATEAQISKKLTNMKSRLKMKTDKKRTGNKPIKMKKWEEEFFNFMEGTTNPTLARVPGKSLVKVNYSLIYLIIRLFLPFLL